VWGSPTRRRFRKWFPPSAKLRVGDGASSSSLWARSRAQGPSARATGPVLCAVGGRAEQWHERSCILADLASTSSLPSPIRALALCSTPSRAATGSSSPSVCKAYNSRCVAVLRPTPFRLVVPSLSRRRSDLHCSFTGRSGRSAGRGRPPSILCSRGRLSPKSASARASSSTRPSSSRSRC